MVQSTQFGSYCSIAEYESTVNTLSLNVDIQATEKLQLNAGVTYNKAEDEWNWDFADRPSLIFTPSPTSNDGAAANPGYDTSDNGIDINDDLDTYSDLSYEQYEFTVGGTYHFTEAFYTSASFTYDIFKMDEEYVYGDEDGTAYYGYVGLGWNF